MRGISAETNEVEESNSSSRKSLILNFDIDDVDTSLLLERASTF